MIWRFAPSPTGYLHLGSLRIALLNYIQAKKANGSLILRIEDTDQKRLVKGSVDNITSILDWTGIKFKQIYFQSDRLNVYRQKIKYLLDHGHAYKCFCSVSELDVMKKDALARKIPFKYNQRCRHQSPEEVLQKEKLGLPFVIRFKVPQIANVQFNDTIHGSMKFEASSLDDLVLLKSDGWPTYHLANVVDDHEMHVEHVIRGQEWISSTPKHVLLYKAFGWNLPTFTHLPLLLNKDGSKLSKRQQNLSIQALKDQGYFPEAIVSFVASLGSGNDQNEGLSITELCEKFDMSKISKSSCIVSLQKLESLNKMWLMKKMEDPNQLQELVKSIKTEIEQAGWELSEENKSLLNQNHLTSLVLACKDRVRKVPEFKHFLKPFFISHESLSLSNQNELNHWITETKAIIEYCIDYLSRINAPLEQNNIKMMLNNAAELNNIKIGVVAKIIRIILTNETVGIDLNSLLTLMDKKTILKRLNSFRT